MSFISVKNWERFQHYKDRDPSWVKLYRDLLTAESWVLGTDTSRLIQITLTLLAARYENRIPYRFDLIKKVGSLDCTEANFAKSLEHLVANDFLEIQEDTKTAEELAQDASNALSERYAREEKRREEKRREEERRIHVELVFDHWKTTWGKPKAKLDDKRRNLIEKAIEAYSVEDLCDSISGYRNSPHHTGQNERQTVYDEISLFLRDASHIDAGLRFHSKPQGLTSSLANHNVAVLGNWKPPELRNAESRLPEISGIDGESSGGIQSRILPATG